MKLLITGGHFSPAMAVAEVLLKKTDIEIYYAGRKEINPEELSFEYKELQKFPRVTFIDFKTGRMTRILSVSLIANILLTIKGFINSYKIINRYKPDKVLSFGGFIALPICLSAYIKNIPVYTHEQTIAPGFTNKIIARFAKKVFVTFPVTEKYFPKNKIIVTGNPIRQIFTQKTVINKNHNTRPVILILGGSLGSHSVNIIIEQIIDKLKLRYQIIHQTGSNKEYNDFIRLSKLQDNYYQVFTHISSEQLISYYQKADLIIARSGANTISELIYLKKPSILIPLPWSANKEQLLHAQLLQQNKVAEIFTQDEVPEKLMELINTMLLNISGYKNNFDKIQQIVRPRSPEIIADILTVSQ